MLKYRTSRPGEFLVVSRGGTLRNRGVGAGAWLGPGASCVRVPTGKEEAPFAMTQESADGIPLRFKGSAVYRVVDPVAAALAFDFESGGGPERLRGLIAGVCLGELRDVVSHMSMRACVEERKTTLTEAVMRALDTVVAGEGHDGTGSWGIAVDVVLVAQVFVCDEELRARLESEERAAIVTRSRHAEIQADEEVRRAQIQSRRRLESEDLEHARELHGIEREKATLRQAAELEAQAAQAKRREEAVHQEAALELHRQEMQAARQRRHLESEREIAELALEVAERSLAVKRLEVEQEMLRPQAEGELERELLPLRQVPEIAQALTRIYDGATLSIYGGEDLLTTRVLPLFDRLTEHLRTKGGGDAA